jgi:uncharacterized cysteine cluster protein YcgN (CxxCxxCC family)
VTPENPDKPYWETKRLSEMTEAEWEALCDGCGKCCLVKLEDEDTTEVLYTGLHCRLLDASTCQCSNYENRRDYVPDCIKLTAETIPVYDWLPKTCAYRLIEEGRPLPEWHHLVCGDREEIHRRGVSAKNKTISEDEVAEEDALDHVAPWANRPPSAYRRRNRRTQKR